VNWKNLIAIILASVVCSAALLGQELEDNGRFLKRFAIGGRISTMGFDLLKTGTTKQYATALEHDYTVASNSTRVGGGASVEFKINPKFWVSADLLYHRFGYRTSIDTYTGTDNPDTTADERTKVNVLEKTRAAFWDVPLLAHYAFWQPKKRMKLFVDAGVTARYVRSVRTATETDDAKAKTCCSDAPVKPAHNPAAGFVGGVGLRMLDEFGLKMTPEVRYTRWKTDAFVGSRAQTQKQQLEILFGITF
jgi:hypothetical protein